MFTEYVAKKNGKSIFRHSMDSNPEEVPTRKIKATRRMNIRTNVQQKKALREARARSRELHRQGR